MNQRLSNSQGVIFLTTARVPRVNLFRSVEFMLHVLNPCRSTVGTDLGEMPQRLNRTSRALTPSY